MKDTCYEFVEIDSDEAFKLLANSLGGAIKSNNALSFNNNLAQGELLKSSPEEGLWIRKWKFTVLQNLVLRKMPQPKEEEKKLILVYFLDPSIFEITHRNKSLRISSPRNNMFFTSEMPIDFSVLPKRPFYVLDITFTVSWLRQQLADDQPAFQRICDSYIDANSILMESCTREEYQTLHELEVSMTPDIKDPLFIRSRIYSLVSSFFEKLINRKGSELINTAVHYEQMMLAETLVMENLEKAPTIERLAKEVNLSASSLLRQFKLIFGKSIYEYYVAKKMEIAKKIILENNITVKEVARMLGYRQPSAFIDAFIKQHACSPGTLKMAGDRRFFV